MNKDIKILFFATLGIAFFAMSDVAYTQVFSPRAAKNSNTSSTQATAPKTPAYRNVQTEQQKAASATTNTAVTKDFSGADKKKEYNNSSPKIVSFKVVNGEVVLDKEKERSILIYYDNYQVHRGLDEYVRCSLRIYVLNDLTEKINSLGFKLYWPEISTSIQMNQLNPGVSTYKDIMLMGDGCFALDGAPTIEVNRCRVKSMSQEKCADSVMWYEKK